MARYVKWVLLIFAAIWAALLGTTLGFAWNMTHPPAPKGPASFMAAPDIPQTGKEQETEEDKDRDGYWTVAVFGVDSRDGRLGKGTRSDMIMIGNVNLDTGEIRLASVYRDTYLRINQEKNAYDKVNQAYFFGGPKRSAEVLEDNLDLQVDDYAAFSWKAVADAINLLGGIDVEISSEEFKLINGFITETVESTGVGSHHLKKAGMNHLDGVQAVAYARLRKTDTDFKRTERQRLVAGLVMDKLKAADPRVIGDLVRTILPQTWSSVGIRDLLQLAGSMKKFYLSETTGFPFHFKDAFVEKKDCVIPMDLEQNVKMLHEFLFDEQEYAPSPRIRRISRQIDENTKERKK